MAIDLPALFVGSHPAMDFLNTRFNPRGTAVELIGDGASFLAWLVAAKLLDASTASGLERRFGTKALAAAAAEARSVRTWAVEWLSRWRDDPRGNYAAELRRLNGLLERAKCHRHLEAARSGLEVVERWQFDSASELITLVAVQIALLVTTEQPALVKRCAGADCTIWFVDRTKAHRRRFCSAAACGNRARVAAFRMRQRAE